MNSDRSLITIAAVVMAVALFSAGFTYYSVNNLRESILTGFATTGLANLTVETNANINFTIDTINWESGRVNPGEDNATLDTAAGTVSQGNWTVVTSGFRVENIGNVNVSFNITFGKTATTFLGGTSPEYLVNVSAVEANSCLNYTYSAPHVDLSNYTVVTTTSTVYCGVFPFANGNDQIEIDLRLVVPSDSFVGELTDTLTSTIIDVSGT